MAIILKNNGSNTDFLKLDQSTPQTITGGSPIFSRSWWQLALEWTAAPTLYDTQTDYKVYEYTYGSTNYYRRVYNTYDPATDSFYDDDVFTTELASRALSLT